jgi:hypothetical protein
MQRAGNEGAGLLVYDSSFTFKYKTAAPILSNYYTGIDGVAGPAPMKEPPAIQIMCMLGGTHNAHSFWPSAIAERARGTTYLSLHNIAGEQGPTGPVQPSTIDFTALSSTDHKSDPSTGEVKAAGRIELYTAAPPLKAGQLVSVIYQQDGKVFAAPVSAVTSDHNIVGVCMADAKAGETVSVAVTGYTTCLITPEPPVVTIDPAWYPGGAPAALSSADTADRGSTTTGLIDITDPKNTRGIAADAEGLVTVLLNKSVDKTTIAAPTIQLYDEGGNTGNYEDSSDYVVTFDAGENKTYLIDFISWALEGSSTPWDYLSVFESDIDPSTVDYNVGGGRIDNGAGDSSIYKANIHQRTDHLYHHMLSYKSGTGNGPNSECRYAARKRYVTFRFESDGSTTNGGWNIRLTTDLATHISPDYIQTTPIIAQGQPLYASKSGDSKVTTAGTRLLGYATSADTSNESVHIRLA